MMKLKKTLALCLGTALCGSLVLAACAETGDPNDNGQTNVADTLKEGYWEYTYTIEGRGNMVRFFHFYDNFVYRGDSGGGGTQGYVYSYSVAETDFDYSVWYSRTEREAGNPNDENGYTEPQGRHTGTADYTITMTDLDGNAVGTIGYDGSYLYTADSVVISDAYNMRFNHDTDENSSNASVYAGEIPQAIVTVIDAEKGSDYFVEINHNGTYTDMMGSLIEGTFTMSVSGGVTTYTLTPDYDTDTGAVLVINADGTGTYTPDGGTAVAVTTNAESEKEVLGTFTGKVTHAQLGETDYTLEMYADGTCELFALVSGSNMSLDTGTYSQNEQYQYVFVMTNAGTLTTTMDSSQAADGIIVYSLTIPANDGGFAEATISLTIDMNQPTEPTVTTLYTLTGTHSQGNFPATLVLKSDGSAEYTVEMPAGYGGTQTFTGTWMNEKATFAMGDASLELTLTISGDTVTAVNTDHAISLELAKEYTLTGTHSQGNFPATLVLKSDGSAEYTVEMPAGYGGTQTFTGTWTEEEVTLTAQQGTIVLTLTISGDTVTAVNTDQAISLSTATEA